jgi:hypothetical protein
MTGTLPTPSRPDNLRRYTAIYALLDRVVEICALAQHRLGLEAVRAVREDLLPTMEVHWIDEATHPLAMTALLAARRRKLSLVECARPARGLPLRLIATSRKRASNTRVEFMADIISTLSVQ